MDWPHKLLFAAFLILSVAIDGARADAMLSGPVFCDRCRDGQLSLFDYPVYGVRVEVVCTDSNGQVTMRREEVTNLVGNFVMRFDGVPDLSSCRARVSGSDPGSTTDCGLPGGPAESIRLVFRILDLEMYTVSYLLAQPPQLGPFCPGMANPVPGPVFPFPGRANPYPGPAYLVPAPPSLVPEPPYVNPAPVPPTPRQDNPYPGPINPVPVPPSPVPEKNDPYPSRPVYYVPVPPSPTPDYYVLVPPSPVPEQNNPYPSGSISPVPVPPSPVPKLTDPYPSGPVTIPPIPYPNLEPGTPVSGYPNPNQGPPTPIPGPITPPPPFKLPPMPQFPPLPPLPQFPPSPYLQASTCSHQNWSMPEYRCHWRAINPEMKVAEIFGRIAGRRYGTDMTLQQGLQGRGDPYRTLLREGITALLNSYHNPLFRYPAIGVVQHLNWALTGSPRQVLITALGFIRANSGSGSVISCGFKPCN